ncbi:MAG: helix-turn-helix domain-containing protein [Sphingobacterium sp.]|jgi:AraC family transcriptional activator of pobA|nr:helix-turn-helix domain-containing protein [Sphingobacterium sp.]
MPNRENFGSKKHLDEENDLVEHFKSLAAKYALQRRPLRFYLNRLDMSLAELTLLTKRYLGKTPKKYLNEILATILLSEIIRTELPFKTLSRKFRFGTSSSMANFVKTWSGMTPREFRAMNCLV